MSIQNEEQEINLEECKQRDGCSSIPRIIKTNKQNKTVASCQARWQTPVIFGG